MKITFKSSPELLRIDEIGESIIEVDDSLRRQVSCFVLAAVRNGGIPLRVKTGFKVSPDGLESVKSNVRLTAKHKAEVKALKPSSLDLEMKLLRRKKERYIESESHMQAIARGSELAMYDAQILNLAHLQEHLIEGERELQRLDESVELDRIYRKQFVQLSEVADWLRKEQGFDVSISESNIPRDDTLVLQLAKWFDKPINDLPPKLRKLADLYIPNWPDLSCADRQARANEADHQWFEVPCNRIAQANSEKEQAKNDPRQVAEELVAWYAVTLDAMTWWGLGSVTPREAAMLLCRFNPHDDKLDPLSLITDETTPADFKRLLRVFEDEAQTQSQARMLRAWHDIARSKPLKYHSWIDAFRQAMTVIEQATNTAPQVPGDAQQQTDAPPSGATEKEAPEEEILRKRCALIAEFESMWPTIEGDLRDASKNGLSAVSKAQHGYWRVKPALAWARERGKILPTKAEAFIRANAESELSVLLRAMLDRK